MKATPNMDEDILDQALAWRGALDGDGADWEGFTLWLEADPKHRLAFDEIELTARIVDDHASSLTEIVHAPATPPPSWFTRRRLMAGGIAAAAAIVVAVPFLRQAPPDLVLQTQASRSRVFALGPTGSVQLAPSSRLIVKSNDVTRLELAEGAAFFSVPHDPGRSITIKAGSYAVTDIGTTFGVNLAGGRLVVGVSQGKVAVIPAGTGQSIAVSAGQQLAASASGDIRLSAVRPRDVASWRNGRLVYENAEIATVAADISRFSGKRIVVDPSLRGRRFSGVLTIGDGSRLLQTFQALTPFEVHPEGDRVRISAARTR